MNKITRSWVALSFAAIGASACGHKGGTGDDAGAAASGNSGINAPGNDAAIVAVAKKMLTDCGAKWDPKKGWPDDCEKAFFDMKVDYGKQDKTLVALLEDADPKVRELGTDGLDRWGGDYKSDKDLAPRVLTALEKETALPFDGELAYVVAHINPTTVPIGDRIKALALKPATPADVRQVLTVWWGQETGKDNAMAYDLAKAYSTSTDKRMKVAGLDGYAEFDESHHDEACAVWALNMADPEKDIGSDAFGHLTHGWSGVNARDEDSGWFVSGGGHSGDMRCSQVDQAIALADTKAKAGKIDEDNYVYGLHAIAADKKATPAQKKAAIAALRDVVEGKTNEWRGMAIEKLVDADPSQKSYVAKYRSDKELASYVKSALEPKKK